MKTFFTAVLLALCPFSNTQAHSGHIKHNMILLGEREVFASHIVYKRPHHYQVLVSLKFDEATQAAYLAAKKAHPQALFILLLDPMEIGKIKDQESLVGSLTYQVDGGESQVLLPEVAVPKERFEVLYLEELDFIPEPEPHSHP